MINLLDRPVRTVAISVAVGALSLIRAARAEAPRAALTVDAIADCPTTDLVTARVDALLGRTSGAPGEAIEVRIKVTFERAPQGFRATLRAEGARSGERVLADGGESCVALGEATALTLALLLDPDAPLGAPSPLVVGKREPPQPSPGASTLPPDRALAPRHAFVIVGGGGEGQYGVLREGSGSLSLLVAIRLPRGIEPRAALFGTFSRTYAAPGGAVEIGLWGGRLGVCGARELAGRVEAGVCGDVAGALLTASASGFAEARTARRPWLAARASVFGRLRLVGPLALQLEPAVVLPLHDERFRVDRVGEVYDSPTVGLALGAHILWTSASIPK